MEKIIVDYMTLDDFEIIKDRLQEEFDEFWTPGVLFSELKNENTKYIVLKENNNILGFAGIWITPDTVELNNIVIKKDSRGKGYSKVLLEKLIEISKETSREIFTLEVSEENVVAINLYKKYGFENVGLRKKYYKGKYDAILMSKKI